jgi:hypothetical protein
MDHHEALPTTRGQWYYVVENGQFGPFSFVQLKQLGDSGRLKPDDRVWLEGTAHWTEAGNVDGLFAKPTAARSPTPPPLPPRIHRNRRHKADDFAKIYQRMLQLAIPVTVATVVIDLVGPFLETSLATLITQLSSLVLLTVVSNMFVYKAWDQIQDGPARTTPGKAVGFRFIPFFCFYWEFIAIKGLAEDVNRYAGERGIRTDPVSVHLSLWYCVVNCVGFPLSFIPFAGALFVVPGTVLTLIVLSQVNEVSMAIADAAAGSGHDSPSSRGRAPTAAALDIIDQVGNALKEAQKIINLPVLSEKHEHAEQT